MPDETMPQDKTTAEAVTDNPDTAGTFVDGVVIADGEVNATLRDAVLAEPEKKIGFTSGGLKDQGIPECLDSFTVDNETGAVIVASRPAERNIYSDIVNVLAFLRANHVKTNDITVFDNGEAMKVVFDSLGNFNGFLPLSNLD